MMRFIRKLAEDFHQWKSEAEHDMRVKEAKIKAYDEIRLYILQEMAGATGYPNEDRSLKFVPKWMFEIYEMSSFPWQRYQDVTAAEQGYNNLLYKNMPVTWTK